MSTVSGYPVRVDADLQAGLSRWLWLVKWLLVIPHYVVLAFLWLAFVVLSVVAFVAILITGRYPRSIFAFNVGVLRWSWRVSYYAYGSLGTDRYPPFSLAERPEYPARLEVAYPERLSRGLVLVKWWLLAIPHYLVIGIFLGGGWYLTSAQDARWGSPGGGLILLMVLVAAVVLLFTGRYPQTIYDFVLGMNRWVLRVAAYAALMTDDYPPFRMDLGGPDPAGTRLAMPSGGTGPVQAAAPPTTPTDPPAELSGEQSTDRPGAAGPTPGSLRWSAGRVLAVVLASLMLLIGCGLLLAGAGLGVADRALRDSSGFLMSPSAGLATPGAALVSPRVQIDAASQVPQGWLGEGKVWVGSHGGRQVFVGVARSTAVDGYLAGVARSTVVDLRGAEASPAYRYQPGGTPARPPGRTGIWVASAAGPAPQLITWPVKQGNWTLVVMNRDGSRGVVADVRIGGTAPWAWWLFIVLLVAGAVLLVAGIGVLIAALSRRQGSGTASSSPAGPGAPSPGS